MSAVVRSPGEGEDRDSILIPSQLRDALVHLHDLTRLETHPLANSLNLTRQGSSSIGKLLRERLLDSIESVRPARDTPPESHAWRSYHLLRLRYLEALDAAEVQRELAISKSEYHRDHQQAIRALGSILQGEQTDERVGRPSGRSHSGLPQSGRHFAGRRAEERRTNLPHQLTSFVGREREIEEVKRLLGNTRLLTLTGTGGCGKTRLAYQVAEGLIREAPGEYPDGVRLVELASLGDPALVPLIVAAAFDVREEPERPILATLVDYLSGKSLLLLLDNCEHLLDACASLVDALLRTCPDLTILLTSREAVGLYGEVAFRVPSLSTPDMHRLPPKRTLIDSLSQYESARLFVERARAVRSSFTLTEWNAPAVAEVCSRLDGIPLALELAAARLSALSIEQVASRLSDRFRLLTGGSRTALRRHQTLKAAIDWSHDLLSVPERVLFRRLAVFAGGWRLEAAEEVCSGEGSEASVERDDVLDLLSGLVGKSLVVAEEAGGETRYRLPETIRQYALEKLASSGEGTAVRNMHREWCLRLLASGRALRMALEVSRHLDRLELEHDNLRAALSWLLETDPKTGVSLVAGLHAQGDTGFGGLHLFWTQRGHPSEGRHWLRETLARAPERTLDRAWALLHGAWLASDQGDLDEAAMLADESLAVARETSAADVTVYALLALSEVTRLQGDREGARVLLEEAQDLGRGLDDPYAVLGPLHGLSFLAAEEGDCRRAREYSEEELESAVTTGNEWFVAVASAQLAVVEQAEGNYARARTLLESAVHAIRQIGDQAALGWSLSLLGYTVGRDGDYERGVALIRESLVVLQSMGHRLRLGRSLCLLGVLEIDRGTHGQGVPLIAAGTRLIGATHPESSAQERVGREASLAAARSALGEEAFARVWAEGQRMTLQQAVDYALASGDEA